MSEGVFMFKLGNIKDCAEYVDILIIKYIGKFDD